MNTVDQVLQQRAADSYRKLGEALGLMARPDPELRAHEFVAYALSGRKDASKYPVAAMADDAYRERGYKSDGKYSVFLPLAMFARAVQPYQTTVSGSGAELVQTSIRQDEFIFALYNRSVCRQLGTRVVGGNRDDVTLARSTAASSVNWVTTSGSPVESGAATESEQTFDTAPLTLAPLWLTALGKMSRLMMQQAPNLFDIAVLGDVLRLIGSAIDFAIIQGSGSGGAPAGVVNTSNVPTLSGASFSYATSVAALETLANNNGIVNRSAVGWLATPTVGALLSQRQVVSGYPTFIWSGNADTGSVNGHPALTTLNAPASTAILADWSQSLILRWFDDQPIVLEVNPFSNFPNGDLAYRVFFAANVAIRHPTSFVVVNNIT